MLTKKQMTFLKNELLAAEKLISSCNLAKEAGECAPQASQEAALDAAAQEPSPDYDRVL